MNNSGTLVSYWNEMTASAQKVLLLQGPIGPFFYQLRKELSIHYHCEVFKINFNGGDVYFYSTDDKTVTYRNEPEDFTNFLQQFIKEHQIDTIICFGHCRIYHRLAKQYCLNNKGKINFWVFEEGYLRPDYITFEKWGVNDYSILARDGASYLLAYQSLGEPLPPEHVAPGFWPLARLAMIYYFMMYRQKSQFPNYQHHREHHLFHYIVAWSISTWRKIIYKIPEKLMAKRINHGQLNPFFIIPLQVYNDSQVKEHSEIKSIPRFIKKVMASFAKNATTKTNLIIKHHPMDRGFTHYGTLIRKLAQYYGIEGRVYYVFDIPLPILMREAKGMVVLNSTSGLSAMIHHLPVKVLGHAHYDINDLSDDQSLDIFWKQPRKPNAVLFNAYRLYHLHKTQINGSFYNRVVWPE